jgi:glycerol kinase
MILALDQSTSATKAMLFSENGELLKRINIAHKQYYPQQGWVEHDAEEIYRNSVEAIAQIIEIAKPDVSTLSIAITNQRETVTVWNRHTGKPVYNAIVWQCNRGSKICKDLIDKGYSKTVKEKSGLLIDPYFSASGIKWILDNISNAREDAEKGDLLFGTIDSWLIWKLTGGKVHATDYTNASRTMLFNIHTLNWDDDLLELFTIPRSMAPKALPCDSVYGETTVEGLFNQSLKIAGVLGDSHGALAGQMCFSTGMGKATYGTGSSVMVNIGESATIAPEGLVTSVGYAALGKVYYAFEGNIHCTGATIKWLENNLEIIESAAQSEKLAQTVENSGDVYFVPAFAGLGAPWWKPDAKAIITGMTLATRKEHIVRAALESTAYQVKDLIDLMTENAGISLKELRVDGGPTRNHFLMQFQADMLQTSVNCSEIEEASAFGAVLMNRFALKKFTSFEESIALRKTNDTIHPEMDSTKAKMLHKGWIGTVKRYYFT